MPELGYHHKSPATLWSCLQLPVALGTLSHAEDSDDEEPLLDELSGEGLAGDSVKHPAAVDEEATEGNTHLCCTAQLLHVSKSGRSVWVIVTNSASIVGQPLSPHRHCRHMV